MSGRPNKEDGKSSGMGLATGFLLAGGAAAVGFMASQLWSEFKAEQAHSSRPSARMESRKKMQDSDAKDEVPEGVKCVICLVNPREIMLEPCNHACICEDCCEKIGPFCPMCRKRIKVKKPIYL